LRPSDGCAIRDVLPVVLLSSDSHAGPSPVDRCAAIDKLDLLLMVDNSNFMTGAQTSLKKALPHMI
jgi:hypothetical protein